MSRNQPGEIRRAVFEAIDRVRAHSEKKAADDSNWSLGEHLCVTGGDLSAEPFPIAPIADTHHIHDLVPPEGRNAHAAGSLVLDDRYPISCVSLTHCVSVPAPPDRSVRKAGSVSRLQLCLAPCARNDLSNLAGEVLESLAIMLDSDAPQDSEESDDEGRDLGYGAW